MFEFLRMLEWASKFVPKKCYVAKCSKCQVSHYSYKKEIFSSRLRSMGWVGDSNNKWICGDCNSEA